MRSGPTMEVKLAKFLISAPSVSTQPPLSRLTLPRPAPGPEEASFGYKPWGEWKCGLTGWELWKISRTVFVCITFKRIELENTRHFGSEANLKSNFPLNLFKSCVYVWTQYKTSADNFALHSIACGENQFRCFYRMVINHLLQVNVLSVKHVHNNCRISGKSSQMKRNVLPSFLLTSPFFRFRRRKA